MYHQAFITVCYMLGARYHSGQSSKGYELLCLAQRRAVQCHSGWNVGRTVEALEWGNTTIYPKGGAFRNAVAYYLKAMKHHRAYL
jgi:hypothetical protein